MSLFDDESKDKDSILDDKIEDALFNKRVVFFNDDVDDKTIMTLIKRLVYLDEQNNTAITIMLNTNGGSLYSALMLYDCCQTLKSKVRVVVQAKAFSAGAFIVASCGSNGLRFAHKNSSFMIHQISSCSDGKFNEIESSYEETKRLEILWEKIISKHTHIDKKKLVELLKKDVYFDSALAKKWGFIDTIL